MGLVWLGPEKNFTIKVYRRADKRYFKAGFCKYSKWFSSKIARFGRFTNPILPEFFQALKVGVTSHTTRSLRPAGEAQLWVP